MSGRSEDRTTDYAGSGVRWTGLVAPTRARRLHLMLAWLRDRPDRAGEVARLDEPCWVGREHAAPAGEAPVPFVRQRPGVNRLAPGLEASALSRRQLRITPADADCVHVLNIGQRALLHNGKPVTECLAMAGDTLLVDDVALFLLDARPSELPPVDGGWPLDFPFGAADPLGLVGESPAAWALRAELAAAAAADAHVLLWGPGGAGLALAARALHALSPRRDGPLIPHRVTGTGPEDGEAALFGSAVRGDGTLLNRLRAAHQGHLLLEGLGALPEGAQLRLAQLLDARAPVPSLASGADAIGDLRLLVTHHEDPNALAPQLLARFGFRIVVSGLVGRCSDIPLLVRAHLSRVAAERPHEVARYQGDDDPTRLAIQPQLLDALLRHEYAGHAQELFRLLDLALTSSRGKVLALTPAVERALRQSVATRTRFADETTAADAPGLDSEPPSATLPLVGREAIELALAATRGDFAEAASLLGVSRHALRRLMSRHRVGWLDAGGG